MTSLPRTPPTAIVALAVLGMTGCASMKTSSPRGDDLAQALAGCRVAEMATGLASDPQLNSVFQRFPEPALYSALVEDVARPEPVRFGALLVLQARSAEQLHRTEPGAAARVMTAALAHDLAGWAWPWGWLWAGGDELGLLGATLVHLGRPAIAALVPLLDDATPRQGYVGSEEAAAMQIRKYRVKDFAAFYLARIAHLELPWEPDLARRDAAIERLRSQLPK